MKTATTAAVEPIEVQFYPCAYTWTDPVFGQLDGATIIIGADADSALKNFRSLHPHLTSAHIVVNH